MPSALRESRLHASGAATKACDELTPVRPISLNLLANAKVLSGFSPDDPTTEVEVPSLYGEHAGLSFDFANEDVSVLPMDEAVTRPPPVLEDTIGRISACPEEESPERRQPLEHKDDPSLRGDCDEELMTPPALPESPPAVAQPRVGSQVESQRESELSINFLVNPESQNTRDREQSTSASMVIQPIAEHDQLKPNTRDGNNKRSHVRYRITTSVGLASEHNFWTGLTQDLSTGGIFVATYANLPLGSQILLSLSLPDGGPKLEVKAEVRWLRVMREDPEQWPGVGLRFVDLSPATKTRIERCLKMRDAMLFEE
jgi:uncharacterized protein (TIGR02266 family)